MGHFFAKNKLETSYNVDSFTINPIFNQTVNFSKCVYTGHGNVQYITLFFWLLCNMHVWQPLKMNKHEIYVVNKF